MAEHDDLNRGNAESESAKEPADDQAKKPASNPPHTTTGPITAPKFGSAGSGGAEIEPGPRRN